MSKGMVGILINVNNLAIDMNIINAQDILLDTIIPASPLSIYRSPFRTILFFEEFI